MLRGEDANNDEVLDYQEFLYLVHNPKYKSVFGHLVTKYTRRYANFFAPRRQNSRHLLEADFTCCPPPIGMIIISIVELILYIVDSSQQYVLNGPIASRFIYDPHKRYEIWRYVTYMFVHIGSFHLVVNLCIQIMLGVGLEMLHRWWRVLLIYFTGVIAGSLGTSIADPTVKLAGASGGVYSLITAYISSIIMNWKEMELPALQLLIFVVITVCDVGTAIYDRYILDNNEHIGYVAHFAGALAGLLVGIDIVRNIRVTKTEKIIRWISIIVFVVLMGSAIMWNIFYPSYFPKQT